MKINFFIAAIICVLTFSVQADICGKTDDRIPSFDSKVGRFVKEGQRQGCGITLISDKCAITIGECAENRDYAEFNVPASIAGIPQASAPEDIYYVKKGSAIFEKRGIGQQWAVVELEPNRVTKKLPGDVQGFYEVATGKYKNNEPIRVVGYGYGLNDTEYVRSGEVAPNTNGDVIHYAQQVSYGKMVKAGIFLIPSIIEHDADTSYGSWGAPVISENTNEVVGINTHGGCKAIYMNPIGARYTNSGTSTFGTKKFKKAIAACLAK